jgi:SAM-dependent methyltransferase
MFAPDQEAVAREMARVCRPGGRIGMANWTPDSMVGDMFRAVSQHMPPPPGLTPAASWGTEERVSELFGPRVADLEVTRQTCPWRFPSAQACMEYFRTWYGPTVAAFSAVGEGGRAALEADLVAVFEKHGSASDGTLAVDVPYLEVVAVR